MVKGHGLLQVTKRTEIGDGPVRTSYYLRRLGIRLRSVFIAKRSETRLPVISCLCRRAPVMSKSETTTQK